MGLKLISAPASEPVTAAEIITRLGITSGDVSSADMDALIKGARQWAEQYTERAFITQTWEKRLDAFSADGIELARGPVQSITSVKYVDSDGAVQTLVADTDYVFEDYSDPAFVLPAYGTSWPSPRDEANAVRVQFVSGYGAASAVPQPIVNAIVLMVGQALRGQSGLENNLYPASVPNAAKEMLNPYRIIRF